jgi:hypothetical protein
MTRTKKKKQPQRTQKEETEEEGIAEMNTDKRR